MDDIDQKIQFMCPDNTTVDIWWDNRHDCVLIVDHENRIGEIEGVEQEKVTLRLILNLFGFDLADHVVECVHLYDVDEHEHFDSLVDAPVKNTTCQFKLRRRAT